jgi:hypothetical protein
MKTSMRVLRLLSVFVFVIALGAIWLTNAPVAAQQRGGQAAAPAGATPQSTAPFDITGYWVSVVSEDWRWRMVTPSIGDVDGVPLNPAGLKTALAWDYQKDVATAGAQCKAYGAGAIMRMPTRIHVTWADPMTLKVETDAGQQTRTFWFDPAKIANPGPRTLQGNSIAQWLDVNAGRGGGGRGGAAAAAANANAEEAAPLGAAAQLAQGGGAAANAPPPGQGRVGGPVAVDALGANGAGGAGGGAGGGGRGGARGGGGRAAYGNGALKVVTTNVRAGYLRKNGVPYSDNAVVTEYFDRLPGPNNTQWLIVRTTIDDPTYLNGPFTVSSNFKLEPDAAKWRPEACQIDPPLVPGEHRRIPFRPGDIETIR